MSEGSSLSMRGSNRSKVGGGVVVLAVGLQKNAAGWNVRRSLSPANGCLRHAGCGCKAKRPTAATPPWKPVALWICALPPKSSSLPILVQDRPLAEDQIAV